MIKQISLGIAAVVIGAIIGTKAFADNEDRRIRIHNESSKRITRLYASPIDQKDWTYNMIRGKGDWIRVGETRVADIDDGTGYCRYDLFAVRADGEEFVKYDVNVCELTDWYLYD